MRHVLCHIILSAGICKLRRGCESLQEHRYEQSHVWSTRRLHSSDIECPPQIVAAPFPNYVLRHDLAEGESLGTSRLVCVTAHLLLNVSRSHLILAHTILDLAGFFSITPFLLWWYRKATSYSGHGVVQTEGVG